MKIKRLDTYRMVIDNTCWVFVTVTAEDGRVGWGEATDSCDDSGLAHLVAGLNQVLAGRDPEDILSCTQEYWDWCYPIRRAIRTYATAWSAVDQALWDLNAQAKGLPLYQLLGGRKTDRVRLYANLNNALRKDRRPERLAENGKKALEAGFQMLKCTPFDRVRPNWFDVDIEEGLRRVEALTEHVSLDKVAVDCHQRFVPHTLGRVVEALLQRYGCSPYWLEDPVDIADYDCVRMMRERYPQIRWAAGEDALHLAALFKTMCSGCYEVLMPDVKFVGGVSAIRALIPIAEESGFAVSPHNPNGPISTAHSAHLVTLCRKDVPLEYPFASVPGREYMVTPNEVVEGGYYALPQSPGLGVSITQEALREYGSHFVNGEWKKI
jgi:galactonate dehydratase